MLKILSIWPQKIIEYSFYLLFFLTPLILTPFNYELFEYNKMMLTYGLTTIIVGSWIIKMILAGKFLLKPTSLDIPLLVFLLSQIVSTFFSIDRHVSVWGYYSRFNGGLLSTISYILLYYAFVTNFPKEKIKKLLFFVLGSGFLVSIYGILEHFGIDKDIWVQDVQNRVFSTLGQPNWLAAYLSVLIPITLGLGLQNFVPNNVFSSDKIKNSKLKIKNYSLKLKIFNSKIIIFYLLSFIFYLTLLFTKSRSGFLGFWIANGLFWLILLFQYKRLILASLIIFNFSLLTFNFLSGAPFSQINRFTLPELINRQRLKTNDQLLSKPIGSSIIDVGVTESGTIRRIVWRGALDIFKNNPLFGTGVETFTFAYYKFRPVEHNMTSEWDFLYNKAHNEYLNYAANSGIFGLGSYLLIILVFIGWNIKHLKIQNAKLKITIKNSKLSINNYHSNIDNNFATSALHFALFAGYAGILITNFFGFSVVVIQLFFFLIPAISFVLSSSNNLTMKPAPLADRQSNNLAIYQLILVTIILSSIFYLLSSIFKLWYADVLFANGYHLSRAQDFPASHESIKKAIQINNSEPLYYDELSYPAAQIALAFHEEKEATFSSSFKDEAILSSDIAVAVSPNNVNFWKTRTRVFFALSQIEEKYLAETVSSLEKAKLLSPTDPKIRYNLALIYDQMEKSSQAIEELVAATKLKPDYRDAFYALGLFYEKGRERQKAIDALEHILTKIATDDAEAKKKLEELR